jgi:hypothetical protein
LSALDHFDREFWPYYPADDGSLRALASALAVMFEPVEQAVRAIGDHSEMSQMLDPTRCPDYALHWLAQFPGVRLVGDSPDLWRRQIMAPSNWRRGSVPYIKATVADTLLPPDSTGTVIVLERQPGLWPSSEDYAHYSVLVFDDEEGEFTQQVVKDTCPSGRIVEFNAISHRTYFSVESQFDTYSSAETAYATYADAEEGP